MSKKRFISVFLAVLIISTAVPVYAAMPEGSLGMIPVTLAEGQTATFRLPDYPKTFTDTFIWINDIEVTTTQYSYVPSMWFKVHVPSEGQMIEWTLAGTSSDTFNDYMSVVITHSDELYKPRCYQYWKVAKSATKTKDLPVTGDYLIQISGSDVSTELEFRFSLKDYIPVDETPANPPAADPIVPVVEAINTEDVIDETPDYSTDINNTTEPLYEPETEPEIKAEPIAELQIDLDSASAWAHTPIRTAITAGYVPQEIQGRYTSTITRAEFCRMAVKWLEYSTGKNIDDILSNKKVSRDWNAFTDTNDPDILAAYALGITSGTGNRQFTPYGEFSREQASTMIRNICNVLDMNTTYPPDSGFEDLHIASGWAVDGINYCNAYNIMNGTSTVPLLFSPKSSYTRQESIATFNNLHNVLSEIN